MAHRTGRTSCLGGVRPAARRLAGRSRISHGHGIRLNVKAKTITAYVVTGPTSRRIEGTAEIDGVGGVQPGAGHGGMARALSCRRDALRPMRRMPRHMTAETMLHYRTYALDEDRDWVVLVHGAGGSSSIWFRQLRAYREEFNVLLVDLRGHGGSARVGDGPVPTPYTFEALSRDVIDVLDHAGIRDAHFVGISLGCLIIRTIAELAPQRVRSMVLGGAVVGLNRRSRVLVVLGNALKRVLPFMWLYRIYAWIIMPRVGHRESRMIFVREAQKLARKEFLRWFRLTMEVSAVLRLFEERTAGIPTLYLMGEEDHMFLPAARRLAAQHRNAVLHVLERCGHVCNIERPASFNRVSIAFMQDPLAVTAA
jgi:pimeloyl-ACP methyl ester carboxylesterase